MENLRDLLSELTKVGRTLKAIQEASTYNEADDLSGLFGDLLDPDEAFLAGELTGIMEGLEKIQWRIEYLGEPVVEEGSLIRNQNGRYLIPGGRELSSGSRLEVLLPDGLTGGESWRSGRIEHNGHDYYHTAAPELPLEGMMARRRDRR